MNSQTSPYMQHKPTYSNASNIVYQKHPFSNVTYQPGGIASLNSAYFPSSTVKQAHYFDAHTQLFPQGATKPQQMIQRLNYPAFTKKLNPSDSLSNPTKKDLLSTSQEPFRNIHTTSLAQNYYQVPNSITKNEIKFTHDRSQLYPNKPMDMNTSDIKDQNKQINQLQDDELSKNRKDGDLTAIQKKQQIIYDLSDVNRQQSEQIKDGVMRKEIQDSLIKDLRKQLQLLQQSHDNDKQTIDQLNKQKITDQLKTDSQAYKLQLTLDDLKKSLIQIQADNDILKQNNKSLKNDLSNKQVNQDQIKENEQIKIQFRKLQESHDQLKRNYDILQDEQDKLIKQAQVVSSAQQDNQAIELTNQNLKLIEEALNQKINQINLNEDEIKGLLGSLDNITKENVNLRSLNENLLNKSSESTKSELQDYQNSFEKIQKVNDDFKVLNQDLNNKLDQLSLKNQQETQNLQIAYNNMLKDKDAIILANQALNDQLVQMGQKDKLDNTRTKEENVELRLNNEIINNKLTLRDNQEIRKQLSGETLLNGNDDQKLNDKIKIIQEQNQSEMQELQKTYEKITVENEFLNMLNENLNKKLEQLTIKNESEIKNLKVVQVDQDNNDRLVELGLKDKEIQSLKDDNAKINQEKDELCKNNETLLNQVTELSTNINNDKENQKDEITLTNNNEQQVQNENLVIMMEKNQIQLQSLQKDLAKVTQERDALINNNKPHQLQSKIKSLQTASDTMKKENDTLTANNQKLNQEIVLIKQEIQTLQDDNSKIKQESQQGKDQGKVSQPAQVESTPKETENNYEGLEELYKDKLKFFKSEIKEWKRMYNSLLIFSKLPKVLPKEVIIEPLPNIPTLSVEETVVVAFTQKKQYKVSSKIQKLHEMLLEQGVFGGQPTKKVDPVEEKNQSELLEMIYSRSNLNQKKSNNQRRRAETQLPF